MKTRHRVNPRTLPLWLALMSAISGGACQEPTCATPGGAVVGAVDGHCDARAPQETSPAACGISDASDGTEMEEAATLFNHEGDDDDCKYHVAWWMTPVCQKDDLTVTVALTRKTDGTVVTGATPNLEIFLGDSHPAPNTTREVFESPPGTYTISPVRLDAAGQWTMRFHFFESCFDAAPDSPHGHVAFYVSVP